MTEMYASSKELFFSSAEYQRRLAGTRAAMSAAGLDLLLVSEPENILYLTGHQTFSFSSYQMAVVALEGEPLLILRHFESMQARRMSWVSTVITWDDVDDPVEVTINALHDRALAKGAIGVEQRGWFLSVANWRRLDERLGGVRDGSGSVESVREVKSAEELAYMKRASRYTDLGMSAACRELRPGATENDLAAAIFSGMTRGGSEWLAKDPIVTSGERSGVPHTTYRRRELAAGDPVLLEFSGVHHRYFAPLMRTGTVGRPTAEIERLGKICIEALETAIAAMKPGVTSGEVDAACVKIIHREGLWENYRKRTGYSVGLGFMSWMEVGISSLKANDRAVLKPGMCYHLPVAVRLYGRVGVGFSETVVVTETGAEALSASPRRFLTCEGA